jgi:glycosyltransferase involved in cell wall biosynthesis
LSSAITVAIPFYRGQDYLRAAIASVLRQSDSNWTLLVCDDGPEAGTEQLVASFGDGRIRYNRNECNLGMAGNWNRCLDLAETDLVNLLHNDDELLPNYVEDMRRASPQFPDAAAFFCTAKIIGSDGKERSSLVDYVKRFIRPKASGPLVLHGPDAIEALARGNFIMCPTVCYRKCRLGVNRFSSDWRFALDLEFFTRLLQQQETLVGLPTAAYAYRRHSENATEVYTRSLLRFEEESRLLDELAVWGRQIGHSRLARTATRKRVVKAHLAFRILQDLSRLRLGAARGKWRFLRSLAKRRTVNC